MLLIARQSLVVGWLAYLFAAPTSQSVGTERNQIVLGVLVAANSALLLGQMVMNYVLKRQQFRHDEAARHRAEEQRRRLERKLDKNTEITAVAAEQVAQQAGNGAAERVRELLARYDDLRIPPPERPHDAGHAQGTVRPDHRGGEGGIGGVLPEVPRPHR